MKKLSDPGNREKTKPIYGVDEKPPLGHTIVYGFQHIFAMILGSVLGAVVIGDGLGLNTIQVGNFIGYINIAMGLATILQVKWGIKLPLIQGSTMGHVPAYVAIGAVSASISDDPLVSMQYLTGALLVGALIQTGIGLLNVVEHLRKIFTPMVVGVIIMMVGLGLWPVINDFIDGAWGIAIITVILVMIFNFGFGITAKTMSLFLTVIIGYILALVGTALSWFTPSHALFVNYDAILEAPWFVTPQLLPWGGMRFDFGMILAMTIPYFATSLESLGDYIAVAESSDVDTPSPKKLSRGIMFEGIASGVSSILGGTASSSFSQNVGIIRLTGVASRFVCIVAGVILILLGFFGKLGTGLSLIPRPILGAVYLVAFGILVMTGLRVVSKIKLRTSRNETILGTSLLLGLAIPAYYSNNPVEILDILTLEVFLNVFLSTPMMVSGVWALILDNLIPGSDEERGITGWLESKKEELNN